MARRYRAVAATGLVLLAGEASAQTKEQRTMEFIGYTATAVMLAQKSCGGGETAKIIRDLANIRDVDFRFGMSNALIDLSDRLKTDTAATCAELKTKYGPNGSVASGAWVTP